MSHAATVERVHMTFEYGPGMYLWRVRCGTCPNLNTYRTRQDADAAAAAHEDGTPLPGGIADHD